MLTVRTAFAFVNVYDLVLLIWKRRRHEILYDSKVDITEAKYSGENLYCVQCGNACVHRLHYGHRI